MDNELKIASNLVPFSKLSDRFVPNGYCDGVGFEEKLSLLSSIEGVKGVSLGWPVNENDPESIYKTITSHGLEFAQLEPDIYTQRKFKCGSLSHLDSVIRNEAIKIVKQTIDAAVICKASSINLWLAQDGFDYTFEGNYSESLNRLIDSLEEIADYNPEMPICLEYKLKEPRANNYVSNCGESLLMCSMINKPHFGITLDYGHSLVALENPAKCLALATKCGRLKQIHLNDNYRDWDHDLIPGTVTFFEHIEFFYWLNKFDYNDWMSLDIFPYRIDGKKAAQLAINICQKCNEIAQKILLAEKNGMFTESRIDIYNYIWNQFIK